MKVAFVCCEYPPGPHGGIGASTQNLARGLVQSGHEVRVVGVYARGYPTPAYEEDRGVRIWRLRRWGAGRSWILDRYRLFRFIARWAKAGQLDLIDVPDYQGWAAGWPRLAVPVISRWCLSASCRSAEIGRRVDLTTFHLERMSLRRADFSCAKSAYLGKRTQEVFRLPFGPGNRVQPGGDPHLPARGAAGVSPRRLCRNPEHFKGIVSLIRAWPMVTKVSPCRTPRIWKDGRSPREPMQAYLADQMDPQHRTSVYFTATWTEKSSCST